MGTKRQWEWEKKSKKKKQLRKLFPKAQTSTWLGDHLCLCEYTISICNQATRTKISGRRLKVVAAYSTKEICGEKLTGNLLV